MKLYRLVLVGLFAAATAALSDVVKLKNGVDVEGTILSESATEVVIESKSGGGSIVSRDTFKMSEIAQITRSTPEEKAQRAMLDAYEATKRCKLDPNKSFALAYYDKVLDGTLRKFIADYPESAPAKEVAEKIMAWEAERSQVAAGKAKYQGGWLHADEVARLMGEDQADALHGQIKALMAAGRYPEAAQRLEQLLSMKIGTGLTEVARRARSECFQKWDVQLREQQQKLETDIPACEKLLADAKKAVEEAHTAMRTGQGGFKVGTTTTTTTTTPDNSRRDRNTATTSTSPVTGPKMGTAGTADAINRLGTAQAEVIRLQSQCPQLRAQLAQVKQTLSSLQARASEAGVQLASTTSSNQPPEATTTAATTAAPEEEGDLLAQMAGLAKKYWMYAAGALLVLVWFVTKRLGQ